MDFLKTTALGGRAGPGGDALQQATGPARQPVDQV